MKVIVLNVQVPFVRGGAEYLADSLARKARGRGHEVEIVNLPFKWYPSQALVEAMLACRLTDLGAGSPDLVIALKFPAYLAPHPRKRVWLLHQFRQAYELWGTLYGLPDDAESRAIREMIRTADTRCLGEVDGLYTISRNVADRLERFNGVAADEVLYPPLEHPEIYRPGEFGKYFFYPSRLSTNKRQHVAIEAMRHVDEDYSLVIAGKADAESYLRQLQELVERLDLGHRVKFLGWISDEEKVRLLAGCRAVVFLPFDEDYGYVTLEAFHSHKGLLTFDDSGATNELVEDGRNGMIVSPTAESLGAAMRALAADAGRAREMGQAASATPAERRIDWPHVLDTLLAESGGTGL